MDTFEIPDTLEEQPLQPIFKFAGIEQLGSYAYALIDLEICREDKTLGHFNARLRFPVRWDEQRTVASVRDWALDLAREMIDTTPVLPWLSCPQ